FMLASFFAIWMALRPARSRTKIHRDERKQTTPTLWQRLILITTFGFAIGGSVMLIMGVVQSFSAPQLTNDGTSLDTNAAMLLLEGRNPYTDSNMLDLARKFLPQPDWTTPLRVGQFADRLDYPTLTELRSVLDTDLKAGKAPEFESKVSYPVLSFLTLVPFTLFKNYNVLSFYILSYLALVVVAWKVARPELRPWVVLLSLANVPMWSSTIGGNLDVFYTLLIVLAWLLRDKRWISAICLGLALASKQIAWYFIPFYIIMVLRHYGFKETIYRLTMAAGVGLAVNLPFILWNPHAWLAGIMAPVADPMFPLGIGFISLSTSHVLPYFRPEVYTALEGVAMVLTLIWYWRICKKRPEAAMLFAVLPLFFAWRSLPSYFYCVAYPIFVLMSGRRTRRWLPARSSAQSSSPAQNVPLLPVPVEMGVPV
ncbi:MAG: DUF2029 domain-containing protein, partial [Ktedonobacteraceae bacterium]|nr:DUF2029 domain-containing protein [Ktedonobacteraceae bacterium]